MTEGKNRSDVTGLIESIRAGTVVYFDIRELDRIIERLRNGHAECP